MWSEEPCDRIQLEEASRGGIPYNFRKQLCKKEEEEASFDSGSTGCTKVHICRIHEDDMESLSVTAIQTCTCLTCVFAIFLSLGLYILYINLTL